MDHSLKKILNNGKKKIGKFLTSKDLLIFLFFLLVSTSLWVLRALRTEYETIITIPIAYEKVPEGLVQQGALPDHLLVTVTDDGTSLVRYRWIHNFKPVVIDASNYTDGRYTILTGTFEPAIQKQMSTTTKIVRIAPATIDLEFEELVRKEVPVVFDGHISLHAQYIKNGDLEIKPLTIEVFGRKEDLALIDHISTERTELKDVQGTINTQLALEAIDGVSLSQDSVLCTLRSERYTEKEIEVPIIAQNAKKGFRLRTFPVTAKVRFHVGLSNFNNVSPESVKLTANYADAEGSRIPLRIEGAEDMINAVEIIPANVDFLLEKND